jgi:hypothetical protein
MSKLEKIRKVLSSNSDIIWNEQSARLPYHRREGSYYSVGIRVAPKEPILESQALQRFSEKLINELFPIGPTNISRCYEFPGVKRKVIKTGAVYYVETFEEPTQEKGMERWIAVSIYPCQVMAENLGFRSILEVRRYECPEPCAQAKKCTFRAPGRRGIYIG